MGSAWYTHTALPEEMGITYSLHVPYTNKEAPTEPVIATPTVERFLRVSSKSLGIPALQSVNKTEYQDLSHILVQSCASKCCQEELPLILNKSIELFNVDRHGRNIEIPDPMTHEYNRSQGHNLLRKSTCRHLIQTLSSQHDSGQAQLNVHIHYIVHVEPLIVFHETRTVS